MPECDGHLSGRESGCPVFEARSFEAVASVNMHFIFVLPFIMVPVVCRRHGEQWHSVRPISR